MALSSLSHAASRICGMAGLRASQSLTSASRFSRPLSTASGASSLTAKPRLSAVAVGLQQKAYSSAPESATAQCTRWLVRPAWDGAARECPTPLVFVRARSPYDGASWEGMPAGLGDEWSAWADMFASRGYTSAEVDVEISSPGVQGGEDALASGTTLSALKSTLNSQLRMLGIPFAPVIIASGISSLVAQAYVSDHPASALVLVSPPPDVASAVQGLKSEVAWPAFNYEPHFPILLLPSKAEEGAVLASRVGQASEEGVGRGGRGVVVEAQVDGPRGEGTRMEVERWMDGCGF